MARFTVNAEGSFTQRPMIYDLFTSPSGRCCVVASTWEKGVVFEGGPIVSAKELQRYTYIEPREKKNGTTN